VPYGEAVTPAKLRMIEQAEYVLRDLGFRDVRVRHHELKSVETLKTLGIHAGTAPDASTVQPVTSLTHLARIELAPAEIPALLADGKLAVVAGELKKIGYAHVTLDLQGYRRGSTNEALNKPENKP